VTRHVPRLRRFFQRTEKLWLVLGSVTLTLLAFELLAALLPIDPNVSADFAFYIRQVDGDVEESYNVEDPYLMWRPSPGYDDGTYRINSMALRDDKYPAEKPANTVRILALGDSSTFGHGVPLAETYHSLLEARLSKEHGPVEVINAGVTGYTAAQGWAYYHYFGEALQPDIVTFYFGPNDIKDHTLPMSDAQVLDAGGPTMVRAIKKRVLHLAAYRLIRRLVVSIKGAMAPETTQRRVPPADFVRFIELLHERLQSRGATLVLISPPLNPRVARNFPGTRNIEEIRVLLRSASQRLGIPLVEVPEMTETAPTDGERYFLDTYHPNAAGHARLAERLYAVMEPLVQSRRRTSRRP